MPLNVAEFIQDFIHADYFMQNEKMESFISIELQPLQKSEFVNIMNELLKSTSNTSPEYPSVLFLAGWSHIYLHEKCDSKQAIAHFTEAGEFNHPLSWLFLASFLWLGYSVKSEQYRKAVTLTEKAISAKCTLAMVVKAEAYVTGAHSTPVCRKTASDLYDLAITYNSTAAMCGRGIMYEQDGDLAAATALFDRAVMLGSSVGQYERGRLYEKAGDKLMAEQYYDQAIAKGNSKAMLAKTNLLLEKGDKVAAIELLDRAYQNKNNTEAKFKRAQLFEEAGDFETATSFYEDCAKKLPAAKVALAKILWNGNGFPQDRQKALSLCKEALDKGFTEMPPLIRGLIEEEKGNYALACEFYNQGVLANDPEAMVLRAKLHLSNRGGPRNQKSAEELLDKAITLNSTEAMYMRANQFLIDKKKVSSADKEKATKLYDQAIALGHFSSLHKRAELYKETDTTMNHMRARVLFTLADAFPKRALLHEDSGVYTLMVSGNDESISLDSFYALGRTLQFLKTLPQNFAKVALIKKNIFDAVNTHIITKYPLDDNFYAKISKLSSGVIDGIVFLLKEYALEKYNEEGYRELQRV
ncbi:MAG: sel1 repeat family protein, partial [Legionella sp.]